MVFICQSGDFETKNVFETGARVMRVTKRAHKRIALLTRD